jgi:hypothetical protein
MWLYLGQIVETLAARLLIVRAIGKHNQIVWPYLPPRSHVPSAMNDDRPAEHLAGCQEPVIPKADIVNASGHHALLMALRLVIITCPSSNSTLQLFIVPRAVMMQRCPLRPIQPSLVLSHW